MADDLKVPGHAFLSYVHEDSAAVDQLARVLRAAGISVWRDSDLNPGDDWRARIRRAITQEALAFIVCFSGNSISKEASYQREELTLAIEQLRLRNPGIPWLLPVRLDECAIPEPDVGAGRTLASIQRADLFGARREEELARLIATVLHILGRRRGAAASWRFEIPHGSSAELSAGDVLRVGQSLFSDDGLFRLCLERDANLIIYQASPDPGQTDGTIAWKSDTARTRGDFCLTLQHDGRLVLQRATGEEIRSTDTAGLGARYLVMQGDGNLVLVSDDGPVWSSWAGVLPDAVPGDPGRIGKHQPYLNFAPALQPGSREAWRQASVTITNPQHGDQVDRRVTVRGTAAGIPDGGTLWLVVRAGRSYYPQGMVRLPIGGAGDWTYTVHFGSPNGSSGHEYTLLAEGADSAARSYFERYMARQDAEPLSDAKGTYPTTAQTLAIVSVTRRS